VAVRVGLVGVGRWGVNIARDVLALGVDLAAVARSRDSVDRAASVGVADVRPRVADLDDVAGVVVATTVTTHAEVVEEALGLGVPVFCEKPLTADPGAAARLAALAPDRLFVMDKWRYHPGVEALARIARSGELGTVVGLRTTRLGWGNQHQGDVDDIWVLAPHDVSIALEILGHVPEPVAARGWMTAGSAGLVGLLGTDPWCTVDVSGGSHERRRRVELVATGGTAWLADGWDAHIGVAPNAAVGSDGWERRDVPGELPLLAELRAFVAHLGGGPAPRSSAAEGVATVAAVAQLRALAGLPPS
jgi:predicted dehydrogenase